METPSFFAFRQRTPRSAFAHHSQRYTSDLALIVAIRWEKFCHVHVSTPVLNIARHPFFVTTVNSAERGSGV